MTHHHLAPLVFKGKKYKGEYFYLKYLALAKP